MSSIFRRFGAIVPALVLALAACGGSGGGGGGGNPVEPKPPAGEGFSLAPLASVGVGENVQDPDRIARFTRVSAAGLSGDFVVVTCHEQATIRFTQAAHTVGCIGGSGVHWAVGPVSLQSERAVITTGAPVVPSGGTAVATTDRVVTGHRPNPTPMTFGATAGGGKFSSVHGASVSATLDLPSGSQLNVGFIAGVEVRKH